MGSAFNCDLDLLLADGRRLDLLSASFAKKLEAGLDEAVGWVEPSPECMKLREQASRSGKALLAESLRLIPQSSNALKDARERFEMDIEALRVELQRCPTSPIKKALLLE